MADRHHRHSRRSHVSLCMTPRWRSRIHWTIVLGRPWLERPHAKPPPSWDGLEQLDHATLCALSRQVDTKVQ